MRVSRHLILLTLLLACAGCEPSDRTPGLWLRGEAQPWPGDWSFTDDHREVALQVSTPYALPHSVTIWCAQVDGALFVAAAQAGEKHWPGWIDADPTVRLKVGEQLFDGRLAPVTSAAVLDRVRDAYRKKYDLDGTVLSEDSRYWQVEPPIG